ncbi:transcriptional regulator [Verrucomicrobium sp. BvORR106]|uniref:transcriptional regulator n=1 Tax=Verrucomicrobium sp. BvORR106 TaxID=1403819 RepID=UPI00068A2366|nr:transcriptional regulator [Verrucomicrobium sp. BvORR106]
MSAAHPIDFSNLDTAVHGPVRLGVLTALQSEGPLDFTTLKARLKTADGALGLHLQKLESIRYISATKRFIGKRPNTTYELTHPGRTALFEYLSIMQRLIDSMDLAQWEKSKRKPQP